MSSQLQATATTKLERLSIPLEFLIDESGQTSGDEHLEWIVSATDEEILAWYADTQK